MHTATATVLAPVIRMADISLAPDSIQNEHAPHRHGLRGRTALGRRTSRRTDPQVRARRLVACRHRTSATKCPIATSSSHSAQATRSALSEKRTAAAVPFVRQWPPAEAGLARDSERLGPPTRTAALPRCPPAMGHGVKEAAAGAGSALPEVSSAARP
ncbi:MAG: hypothetical protein MZV63_27095 [Marinilabiliales bacterium]|nr:hypothetical protein [Marinilabiliales bacterium]